MIAVLRYLAAASAVAILAGCSAMGGGQGAAQNPTQAQAKLASKSAALLQRQMSQPPQKRIPQELVADAKCIGVFPSIVQAGLIIGGHHGKGLITCRQASGGWSQAAPVIYSVSGGSIGLQAGVQNSSVILLFETQDSVNGLLKTKLKLGTQLGVRAGPVGLNNHVANVQAPIVAYVTSQSGLFGGANLHGNRLSYNQAANAEVYNQVTDQRALLLGRHTVPALMEPYSQALQNFAPSSQ